MLVNVYARIMDLIVTCLAIVFLPNPPKKFLNHQLFKSRLNLLKCWYWLVKQEYNIHVTTKTLNFAYTRTKTQIMTFIITRMDQESRKSCDFIAPSWACSSVGAQFKVHFKVLRGIAKSRRVTGFNSSPNWIPFPA